MGDAFESERLAAPLCLASRPDWGVKLIIAVTGGIIGGLFGEVTGEKAKSLVFQFEGFQQDRRG